MRRSGRVALVGGVAGAVWLYSYYWSRHSSRGNSTGETVGFAKKLPSLSKKSPSTSLTDRSLRKRLFVYALTLVGGAGAVCTAALSPLLFAAWLVWKAYKTLTASTIEQLTLPDILRAMTLEEKVSMMAGSSTFAQGGCARLGVPPLKFSDGPSGARGMATMPGSILEMTVFSDLPLIGSKASFQNPNTNTRPWWIEWLQKYEPNILMLGPGTMAVCAPCGTCLAATFDPSLATEMGKIIARDCRSKGAHILLGPTLNLTRTPTGGRNFEAFGEDPFLAAAFGTEWVLGAQSVPGVAACVKHFACNEFERFRFHVDCQVPPEAMHELYLRHFEMVIKDSNVACVMTGYNKVNGVYACSSEYLLKTVLRKSWGFEGVVMSDWGGTHDLKLSSEADALDLEMPGPPYVRGKALLKAVRNGDIKEADIDAHVLRLLTLTERVRGVGPGVKCTHEWEGPANSTDADIAMLRKTSRDAIVLLKNEAQALPVPSTTPLIVTLFGPNACNYSATGGGSVETLPPTPSTLVESMSHALPGATLKLVSGKHIGLETASSDHFGRFLVEVFATPNKMDVDEVCLGSVSLDVGKMFCPTLSIITWSLLSSHVFPTAKWDACGVKVSTKLKAQPGPEVSRVANHTFSLTASGPARLSVDGKVVCETPSRTAYETDPNTFGWSLFSFGSKPVVGTVQLDDCFDHDVVIEWAAHRGFVSEKMAEGWESNMQGREGCPFAFELKHCSETISKQVQEDVKAAARDSQYCIAAVGRQCIDETEMIDVASMELDSGQLDLIKAMTSSTRGKTVVLLNAGSPVSVEAFIDDIDACCMVWFGGQEGTNAIADVLSGAVVPSGKLPFTVPRKFEDNPTFTEDGARFPGTKDLVARFDENLDVGYRFYDRPENRTKVRFPFGFGLSYTTFSVKFLYMSPNHVDLIHFHDEEYLSILTLKVRCTVRNEGTCRGAEVVQVYMGSASPKQGRPLKEFVGFAKVWLDPGESQFVDIPVNLRRAVEHYSGDHWVVETGSYDVYVGTSVQQSRWAGSVGVY